MTCSSTHDPNKLHTELLERNRGSARSGLRPRSQAEEERKKNLAGTPWALWSSLQREPSPTLGRNRKQPSACSHYQAGWQEAGALEWLPAATVLAEGLGFLL